MELIKVVIKEGIQVVSAKELYEFLTLDKSHYARWCKKCFIDNDFVEENIDYTLSPYMVNGSITTDYIITIELAKKIGMMAKSVKGEEIRNYFIDCEKRLQYNLPLTYLDALEALVDKTKENIKLLNKVEKDKEKVDFYDTVAEATECFDFIEVAGILKIPHGKSIAGRNQLYEILRKLKYIQPKSTVPYKSKINEDIFKLVEVIENSKVFTKTVVTQKGVIHLQKLFNK
jgi:phage anti-repressor protein